MKYVLLQEGPQHWICTQGSAFGIVHKVHILPIENALLASSLLKVLNDAHRAGYDEGFKDGLDEAGEKDDEQ